MKFQLQPAGAHAEVTGLTMATSAYDLVSQFVEAVSRDFGRFVDGQIVGGTGGEDFSNPNQFNGIVAGLGTLSNSNRKLTAANTAVTVSDLEGVIALLDDLYQDNATWVMKSGIMLSIRDNDFGASKPGRTTDDIFAGGILGLACREGTVQRTRRGTRGLQEHRTLR